MKHHATQQPSGTPFTVQALVSLRCWVCGEVKRTVAECLPRFGFELVQITNDAGWVGMFDPMYRRVLVFCSWDCVVRAKTNKGYFRKYPPKEN